VLALITVYGTPPNVVNLLILYFPEERKVNHSVYIFLIRCRCFVGNENTENMIVKGGPGGTRRDSPLSRSLRQFSLKLLNDTLNSLLAFT